MASRSGRGRGTLELRRVFGRGVHAMRLRVASGVTDPRRHALLDAMLLDLWQTGRSDVLESIIAGTLTPLEVYRYWKSRTLHQLPTAELLRSLEQEWTAWTSTLDGDAHRRAARRSLALLLAHGATPVLVGHLPAALANLREGYEAHPRTVNLARDHARAFVRDTLTTAHPLYAETKAVRRRPHRAEGREAPTPQEVATWAGMVPLTQAAEMWSMYLTSMGAKEYWIDGWEVQGDRVWIGGLKRAGRTRIVPRLGTVVPPSVGERRWRTIVRATVDAPNCTPHGLRKGFAHLAQLAGIPVSRIRRYIGHGPRSVTDLYLKHDIEPHLEPDRQSMTNILLALGITAPGVSL